MSKTGSVHERVVELEAGRPDDRAGTEPAAVAKAHLGPGHVVGSAAQLDAVPAASGARA